ncbi:MAG: phosphoenolpyruvate carboxykinase domain-containing protein, partial [Candidatus Saganbacteria bacterium]|nr:phosphoenolpyruvate carboxykinase domain-containing protein [Candidatus Saganbacteria bacterium]
EHHHGVPISAIIFGGRRAKLAPLVYESFNWQHGVYVGATMASERTAAQYGVQGEVRRDPMAMLPFCGYNMANYFRHWLEMGKKMAKRPKIFNVNWFRQDLPAGRQGDSGNYLWPGFSENLRVLEWIIARCRQKAKAEETPIGYIPRDGDIDLTGLDLPSGNMEKLLSINKEEWKKDLEDQKKFFEIFGKDLPPEILEEYNALKRRLGL